MKKGEYIKKNRKSFFTKIALDTKKKVNLDAFFEPIYMVKFEQNRTHQKENKNVRTKKIAKKLQRRKKERKKFCCAFG